LDHACGRRNRRVGSLVGLLAALSLLVPSGTFAWTQLFNNYPGSPTSCNDIYPYYCVEWLLVGGSSSTVVIFLDPSLTSANLNLDTDTRSAINQWHLVCAMNPILQTGSGVNAQIVVARGSLDDPSAWAETRVIRSQSSPYVIVSADTTFNTLVTWNHSYTYDVTHADSRKVATHELGHAEGLGHTGYTAVMHQGAMSFWTVQTNDIQGMQAVYGRC
jgi:hypothetical protein